MIPYSILDLATVVSGDSIKQTFEKSVEAAKQAEKLGYTRYWFSEHHNMPNVASAATVLLISHIAEHTQSIRVGSGGIMLPNHSPLIVAEQFGTLGTLFPNRIDLGLGRAPGTDMLTAAMIRRQHPGLPYDFKEHIEELQQYMSSENSKAKVRAIPGEGVEVPLWILGSSTDSAVLAASLGLPYAFASHFAPTQMMAAFDIYKNNFQPSDALNKPYYMACIPFIGAESDDEAAYLSTSIYQSFLGIITDSRKPLQPPLEKEEMDKLWTEPQQAAVLQMLSYAIIGSKKTAADKLSAFIEETGIHEVMILSNLYEQKLRLRSLEIFSEIVQEL